MQPVLDRHCTDCHGLQQTAGGVNLLGTIEDRPAEAMHVLASCRSQLTRVARGASRDGRGGTRKPMPAPPKTICLMPVDWPRCCWRDEHHDKLDSESLQRVVDWLDLNAQFFGDYSWNKVEWRRADPEGERALRETIREKFGFRVGRATLCQPRQRGTPHGESNSQDAVGDDRWWMGTNQS
ncbi:MAG: hypothetical protein R3C56_36115 [Pirellulaceae bacterium]